MLAIYLSALSTEDEKSKFTELYLEYKNLMYHIAYNILRDEQDAEDMVHKAFLSILKNFNQVEDIKTKKTKNWVALIVRNHALNFYTKRQNRCKKTVYLDEIEEIPNLDCVETVTDEYDLKELIALMPIKYRDILQLVIVYEHDYKHIAQELSITPENARKRFQRAKSILKQLLREKGEFMDDL